MEKIKVGIVEDSAEVREHLQHLLASSDLHEEIFCYVNAADALHFMPRHQPDVVLMDIGLPDGSGIECVKQLKPQLPATEFLMLTVLNSENNIFEALKSGASGYLLKNTESQTLLNAINEINNGGSPMSPSIARKVTNFFNLKTVRQNYIEELTERENQLLGLISQGLLYKEVAEELNITTGTVKQHIHKIYKKLQVQNKTEAINKFLGR